METTAGFYKLEDGNWQYAPNFVDAPNYQLLRGADVNAKDFLGKNNPIDVLALGNRGEIVRILTKAGAKSSGGSSIHFCAETGDFEGVQKYFDIDGNNKVNLNDMYILWKYFNDNLNQTDIFKYIEPKSIRKTVQEIVSYIEQKTGKFGGKSIKEEFFGFNYSSSIDPTGSYLAPYITTVGLYSGADLVEAFSFSKPKS